MVVLYRSWKLFIINFFQHLFDTLSILCVQCVHDATFLYIMQQDAFKNGIWIVFISATLNLRFMGKTNKSLKTSNDRSQFLFCSAIQFCCCSKSAKWVFEVHPYLNSTLAMFAIWLFDLAPVLSSCKAKEKKKWWEAVSRGDIVKMLLCHFTTPPL